MEIDLLVHGTPRGQSYWGPQEEANYVNTLYTNNEAAPNEYLRVEIRANGSGKRYCYYHFMVYGSASSASHNMQGMEGRSGSYFALTLRLENYFDVHWIYSLLDAAYRGSIIGYILKPQGDGLRYVVPDMRQPQEEKLFNDMQRALISQIVAYAEVHGPGVDISRWPDKVSNPQKINLCDLCRMPDIASYLASVWALEISPFFPSESELTQEQRWTQKLESQRQQAQQQLQAEQQQRQQAENEYGSSKKQLKNRIDELQRQCDEANRRVDEHKGEISRLKELLDQIVEPLRKIAPIISEQGPLGPQPPQYPPVNGPVSPKPVPPRYSPVNSTSGPSVNKTGHHGGGYPAPPRQPQPTGRQRLKEGGRRAWTIVICFVIAALVAVCVWAVKAYCEGPTAPVTYQMDKVPASPNPDATQEDTNPADTIKDQEGGGSATPATSLSDEDPYTTPEDENSANPPAGATTPRFDSMR